MSQLICQNLSVGYEDVYKRQGTEMAAFLCAGRFDGYVFQKELQQMLRKDRNVRR